MQEIVRFIVAICVGVVEYKSPEEHLEEHLEADAPARPPTEIINAIDSLAAAVRQAAEQLTTGDFDKFAATIA